MKQCKHGHDMTPENSIHRPGRNAVWCRKCANERSLRSRRKRNANMSDSMYARQLEKDRLRKLARNKGTTVAHLQVLIDNGLLPRRAGKLADRNALDYLKLNPAQSQASDALGHAIAKAIDRARRPNCIPDNRLSNADQEKHRAKWDGYDERTPPSPQEAEDLCAGCDVLVQCLAYAKTLKPKSAVMGGFVWVDGKVQK